MTLPARIRGPSHMMVLLTAFVVALIAFPETVAGQNDNNGEELLTRALKWTIIVEQELKSPNTESRRLQGNDDAFTAQLQQVSQQNLKKISVASKQVMDSQWQGIAAQGWSEPIFLRDGAECFVPLCGEDFEPLEWIISTLEDRVNFTQSASFESCCPGDVDNSDFEGCVPNSLQSCRDIEFEALCDTSAGGNVCFEDSPIYLETDFVFESTQEGSECCKTCTCYGDPRCVDFDGEADIWILCDGRAKQGEGKNPDRCTIQKETCLEQKDHEDNQCRWWTDVPDDYAISLYGSRCLPNLNSGGSWLTMYETTDFKFEIRQGERGVIKQVNFTTMTAENKKVVYSLDAETCFEQSLNWTIDLEDEPVSYGLPSSFIQEIDEANEDVIWLLTDILTLIKVRIRCMANKKEGGLGFGTPRINVETLIEPKPGRSNKGGYCHTGDMKRTGSTSNTDMIEAGQGCVPSNVNDEEIDVAKLICGQFINQATEVACIDSFCEAYAFPNLEVLECEEMKHWKNRFCEARTFNQADKNMCTSLWDNDDGESGPEAAIEKYLGNYPTECIDNVADLPTSLSQCEAGMELQYFNGEEWVTKAVFSEVKPPCQRLFWTYADHKELFENPIRVKQCSVPSSCTNIKDECGAQSGLSLRLTVVGTDQSVITPTSGIQIQPTVSPTSYPTNEPTDSPTTSSPTVSPTEKPTNKPTVSPTKNPTKEPTNYPTNEPTDFTLYNSPSLSPTSSSPTSNPTNWPTSNPTNSPSYSTGVPSSSPTTSWPTSNPTDSPSYTTGVPSSSPTTSWPTSNPTDSPSYTTGVPSSSPTTSWPTSNPTTGWPTSNPTGSPSYTTRTPSWSPNTSGPTSNPSISPSETPSLSPTTSRPTSNPTNSPSTSPSLSPTTNPTTTHPTSSPTKNPTTSQPTSSPTKNPTTTYPTSSPTKNPTTSQPTSSPTKNPTTSKPTSNPTENPTISQPTSSPTKNPTKNPTTSQPTSIPTKSPEFVPEPNIDTPTTSPQEIIFIPSTSPTESPTSAPTKPKSWGRRRALNDLFLENDSHSLRKKMNQDFQVSSTEMERVLDEDDVVLDRVYIVFYGTYDSQISAHTIWNELNVQKFLQKLNGDVSGNLTPDSFTKRVSITGVDCKLVEVNGDGIIEEDKVDDSGPVPKEAGINQPNTLPGWAIGLICAGALLAVGAAGYVVYKKRQNDDWEQLI